MLDELAVTFSVCDSFAAPLPIPVRFTVCSLASSFTILSGIASSVGWSFTAVIVIVNVCTALVSTPLLSVPPSS